MKESAPANEKSSRPPHSMKGHCCSNYWWDDPMSPYGVKNMTTEEPTELDDALYYLVDTFSRFLPNGNIENHLS